MTEGEVDQFPRLPAEIVSPLEASPETYVATSLQLSLDSGQPLKDKELLFAVGGRAGLLVQVPGCGKETLIKLEDITRG